MWDRETGQAAAQRHQLAGHAHRPHRPGAVSRARRTTGSAQRSGLPPATYFSGPKLRWLLDTVPGLRERADAGEVLFGTMDSWLDLAAHRPPPDRRHQRQPDDADGPATRWTGTTSCWRRWAFRARCCPRSGPRRRSTATPTASSPACRWPPRSATSRRPCSARRASPRRGQVHVRDRQLPAAQHRSSDRSVSASGLLTTLCCRVGDEPPTLRAGGLDRRDRRARAVVSRQPRR